LDKHGLPTPQEVAVALRSDQIDHKLLCAHLETPSPLALYGRPFSRYPNYWPAVDSEEFLNLADLYAVGARHGWAWWELAHGIATPRYSEPRGIWYENAPEERIMDFHSTDLEFALETKRYGESGGVVDHDVTMPAPISYVVNHFRTKGWPAKALLDLCGMYVTAFRHAWFVRAAKTGENQ